MPRFCDALPRLRRALGCFARDTRAAVAIEAVIYVPMLCWTFVAFSVGFDAYRDISLAQKATFTVADIISRERDQVRSTYLLNYLRVFNYVAEVPGTVSTVSARNLPSVMRVTSVIFSEGEDEDDAGEIAMLWSMTTDANRLKRHDNTSIQALKSKIPALQDGDNVVVVETRLTWKPNITVDQVNHLLTTEKDTWFSAMDIDTITTVRPRFVPKVCAQDGVVAIACEL